jgi:hypothetical protein
MTGTELKEGREKFGLKKRVLQDLVSLSLTFLCWREGRDEGLKNYKAATSHGLSDTTLPVTSGWHPKDENTLAGG